MKDKLPTFRAAVTYLTLAAGTLLVLVSLYRADESGPTPRPLAESALAESALTESVPGTASLGDRSFVTNALPATGASKLKPIPIDDEPASAPPQPVSPDPAPTAPDTTPLDPDEQLADAPQRVAGQPLVAQAAQRLDSLPAVAARVRQQVDLFGQQISGVGQYQQQGVGRTRRIRLELKFKVGDQLASWQQVSDGRFYWQRRDLPGLSGLSRIDLRRVRETLDAQTGSAPPALQQWMILGGLGRLLAALDHYFTFGEAEPAMLHGLDGIDPNDGIDGI
ncbi:MAG: hypothetical protein ACKPEY_16270, partial [Planctomycetota bacterium]